ncbi:hypothetical protein DQ384_23990 [Sphaerisporangium album]|uniref:CBU-0592-like domain-containing protein n=1 Tax=Sphaerisporangium album TaxID=509200 RepID=A0A367FEN0_9ACTN|nr:hypothetical protein DQ384_23990 [Sphaerisporangium album]
MAILIDVAGILGAASLLYAYAMLSMSKMSGAGLTYQVINLWGAAALMVNSAYHFAWPSAVLNLIWCGVGVLALTRIIAARPWKRRQTSGGRPG